MSTPSLHKVPSEQVPMALLLEADPSPSVIARYLQDGHCVVARLDDAVVGVYVIKALTADTWELMNIAVAPEHQGQGIGAALLEACFDWALQGGLLRKINLQVRADNTRAIALYERKGFAHVGRLHQEMYLHGTYYDVLWMEKFLAVNPHS